MAVKARNAHPRQRGEIGDPQRLGIMVADMRRRPADPRGMGVGQAHLPQHGAQRPAQQPPDDLAPDQRPEHRLIGRAVEQIKQPPERIAQGRVMVGAGQGGESGRRPQHLPPFRDQFGHGRGLDRQRQRKIGLGRARLHDARRDRQVDRGEQALALGIMIGCRTEHRHLGPLHDQAEGRSIDRADDASRLFRAADEESRDGRLATMDKPLALDPPGEVGQHRHASPISAVTRRTHRRPFHFDRIGQEIDRIDVARWGVPGVSGDHPIPTGE